MGRSLNIISVASLLFCVLLFAISDIAHAQLATSPDSSSAIDQTVSGNSMPTTTNQGNSNTVPGDASAVAINPPTVPPPSSPEDDLTGVELEDGLMKVIGANCTMSKTNIQKDKFGADNLCSASNITLEKFKLKIAYDQKGPSPIKSIDLGPYECKPIYDRLFCAEVEGSKLCAYYVTPMAKIGVAERISLSQKIDDEYVRKLISMGVNDTKPLALPSYAMYDMRCRNAPPPLPQPHGNVLNNFLISPVCSDFTKSSSYYVPYSLTGAITECVEETMMNLFMPILSGTNTALGGKSLFVAIQDGFKKYVFALMVLFVAFYGFKITYATSFPGKTELLNNVIKLSLVYYFAVGTGINDWIPDLIAMSKGASSIAIDAASGTKKAQYVVGSDGINALLGTDHKWNVEDDQKVLFAKDTYPYCDFSKASYPDTPIGKSMPLWDTLDCKIRTLLGAENYGSYKQVMQVILDKDSSNPFVKLREKLRNLVSDNVVSIDQVVSAMGLPTDFHPKILYIVSLGIPSFIFGGVWAGLEIFVFGMIYLIITTMVILKIVHTYIIAFTAIIVLSFLAPILVPMALFPQTKFIFDAWLKYIISYALQPVVMFVFLAIFFLTMDNVIYGNNHIFDQAGNIVTYNQTEVYVAPIGIDSPPPSQTPPPKVTEKCYDNSSLACIYKTIKIQTTSYDLTQQLDFINFTTAGMHKVIAFVFGVNIPYYRDPLNDGGVTLMWHLLRLAILMFFVSLMMGLIEELAQRLTQGVGTHSAASMSPMAPPAVSAVAGKFGITAPKKLVDKGKEKIDTVKKKTETLRNLGTAMKSAAQATQRK